MKRYLITIAVIVAVLAVAVTVYATTRVDSQIDRNRIDRIDFSCVGDCPDPAP